MQDNIENYRGHAIIPAATGPGPFVSVYTVWAIEPHNSYRATLQGTLPEVFSNIERAYSAAITEAKIQLDKVLD